jgi:hypothetical protein
MILERWQVMKVMCPKCDSPAGVQCTSPKSGNNVNPHKDRSDRATQTFAPKLWQEMQAAASEDYLRRHGYL